VQGDAYLGSYKLLYYPEGLPVLAKAEDYNFFYALSAAAGAAAGGGQQQEEEEEEEEEEVLHVPKMEAAAAPESVRAPAMPAAPAAATEEQPQQQQQQQQHEKEEEGLEQAQEEAEAEARPRPGTQGRARWRQGQQGPDSSGWGLASQALVGAAALLFLPILAILGITFVIAR